MWKTSRWLRKLSYTPAKALGVALLFHGAWILTDVTSSPGTSRLGRKKSSIQNALFNQNTLVKIVSKNLLQTHEDYF